MHTCQSIFRNIWLIILSIGLGAEQSDYTQVLCNRLKLKQKAKHELSLAFTRKGQKVLSHFSKPITTLLFSGVKSGLYPRPLPMRRILYKVGEWGNPHFKKILTALQHSPPPPSSPSSSPPPPPQSPPPPRWHLLSSTSSHHFSSRMARGEALPALALTGDDVVL